jgi:hypothetical protein
MLEVVQEQLDIPVASVFELKMKRLNIKIHRLIEQLSI